MSSGPQLLAALTIMIMFIHAAVALGFATALGFAAIVAVVTFAVENLGVATGFPFGEYHFVVGANLPHVGHIPVIVGPLYFGVGYGAYVIAVLLAGQRSAADRWLVPFVATLAITFWDLSMEPVNSTVQGLWVWHKGGPYFGVPLSNFVGWLLEMGVAFALADSFLRFMRARFDFSDRGFWLIPILLYAASGLCQVLPWITSADVTATDASGMVWSVINIHRAAVATVFLTMMPLSLLAIWRLWAPIPRPARLSNPGLSR